MVRLLVVGPNGSLGRALVKQAAANPEIDLVGGVGPEGRDYIGADLGLLVGLGHSIGAQVLERVDDVIGECDVVIDGTRPDVSMDVLAACVEHGKAFVTGTTGFSDEQLQTMEHASSTIPMMHAANGSRVVHLLYELVRTVAERFGREADIDIVEIHNRKKPDAPSGTAQEIAGIIAKALGQDLQTTAAYGRKGIGTRASDSIQFSSIRSGGTPSTHQVMFGFPHERLELTHRTQDPMAFAEGLIQAVLFVSGKEPGRYTLDDVI